MVSETVSPSLFVGSDTAEIVTGLVIVQVKVSSALFVPSVAMTVTLYGP